MVHVVQDRFEPSRQCKSWSQIAYRRAVAGHIPLALAAIALLVFLLLA